MKVGGAAFGPALTRCLAVGGGRAGVSPTARSWVTAANCRSDSALPSYCSRLLGTESPPAGGCLAEAGKSFGTDALPAGGSSANEPALAAALDARILRAVRMDASSVSLLLDMLAGSCSLSLVCIKAQHARAMKTVSEAVTF